ncbi:DUF805 domain-containing protein [uncultured Polaribacter sp.]|uniref:DUF805 domain-containing protein n=1 Tax=uncultured Polaribacter sp. TaxID=174711 RepID=UPI00261AB907|nr:DUF805 domain-containing protein [uncultured Polaribacter sp.]
MTVLQEIVLGGIYNFKLMIKILKKIICNTFVFKGFTNRKEFWTYFLFFQIFINSIVLSLIFGIYESWYLKVNNLEPSGLMFRDQRDFISIIIFIPLISATVRRLRDAGVSIWFVLLPVVNLILCLKPSKKPLN